MYDLTFGKKQNIRYYDYLKICLWKPKMKTRHLL
jgi:hypothetical protein